MPKRSIKNLLIVSAAITSFLIIIGCGEDELYSPPKATLNIIELKSSSTELESGDTATIEATIEYTGEKFFLSYTWNATGGNIIGNGNKAVYTAPEEGGVQTITFTVTDEVVIAQRSINISVKAITNVITIGSNVHWPATALNDVLLYEVTVENITDDRVELKYDITQDQDRMDAFFSITVNGVVALDRKAIGNFLPSTGKRTIDKVDVSNLIQTPGKYIVEFSLKVTNRVQNGWLLNKAELLRVEGTSKRLK